MARTLKQFTGVGDRSSYPVNFGLGFISREHVYVYTGDLTEYKTQLNYTWSNSNTIELSEPLPNGQVMYIRRVVPRDELINDYEDGAILKEKNLDASFLQSLMIIEEIQDGFFIPDGNGNVTFDENNDYNIMLSGYTYTKSEIDAIINDSTGGINLNAGNIIFSGSVDYAANNVEDALEKEATLRNANTVTIASVDDKVTANNLVLGALTPRVQTLENEMAVVQQRSLSNLIDISSLSSSKANRAIDPVVGNIATLDAQGDVVDSGSSLSDFATNLQGQKADSAVQPNEGISTLNNDVGYITSIDDSDVISALGYTPANIDSVFSGNYDDLTNKPDIPKLTSELTNDSGFVTSTDVSNKIDKVENPTESNIPVLDSNGNLVDSGVNLSTLPFDNTGTDLEATTLGSAVQEVNAEHNNLEQAVNDLAIDVYTVQSDVGELQGGVSANTDSINNLGEAATYDVGVALGELMSVGAFGLGETDECPSISDIDGNTTTGLFRINDHTIDSLPIVSLGVLIQVNRAGVRRVQIFIGDADGGRMFFRVELSSGWQAWKEVGTKENPLSVGDLTVNDLVSLDLSLYPTNTVIQVNGYTSVGDGCVAHWKKTGSTGTAGRDPEDKGDGTLNDGGGNEFQLVHGTAPFDIEYLIPSKFATLQEAVDFTYDKIHFTEGSRLTLRIENTHEPVTGLSCIGMDLSHVIIRSTVSIVLDAMASGSFLYFYGTKSPEIDANFDAINTTELYVGLHYAGVSSGNINQNRGFKNVRPTVIGGYKGDGLLLENGSTVNASGGVFQGCKLRNVHITTGSTCELTGGDASYGLGDFNIWISRRSRLVADGLTCVGGTGGGIAVLRSDLSLTPFSNADVDISGNGGDNININDNSTVFMGARSGRKVICSNAGRDNIYIGGCSRVDAEGADLSNAGRAGINATATSQVHAVNADITNASSVAVTANGTSSVDVDGSDCSGHGDRGIHAKKGSIINARIVNAVGSVGSSTNDFLVEDGATIVSNGGTGGVSQTINTLTRDGVIFG